MSLRDFRCQLSGISLLHAECALVLLSSNSGRWVPLSLPLWGVYEGVGTLGQMDEGPNAELILAGFQRALREGRAELDRNTLGDLADELDHVETLVNLIAFSQVQGLDAVRWEGQPVGFALASAHVAAAFMTGEPELSPDLPLEGLPGFVLPEPASLSIYAPLSQAKLNLRCKFGLSFYGFLALTQEFARQGRAWAPPGLGIDVSESRPQAWLAEAMLAAAGHEELLEALREIQESGSEDDVALIDDLS